MKLDETDMSEFLNAPSVFYAKYDSNEKIVKLSSNIENLLGYDIFSLAQASFLLGIIHPDDLKTSLLTFFSLSKGDCLRRFKMRCQTKDGVYIQISLDIWKPCEATTCFLIKKMDKDLDFDRSLEKIADSDDMKDKDKTELTETEAKIFQLLNETSGQPVNRETLLKEVYYGTKVQAHTINVHICNLRKKLKNQGFHIQRVAKAQWALKEFKQGEWELDLRNNSSRRSLKHDEIFGYNNLLPSWNFEDFISHVLPVDRQIVIDKFEEAIQRKTTWRITCRIKRINGEIRWIYAQGRQNFNLAGEGVSFVGEVLDVGEEFGAKTLNKNKL